VRHWSLAGEKKRSKAGGEHFKEFGKNICNCHMAKPPYGGGKRKRTNLKAKSDRFYAAVGKRKTWVLTEGTGDRQHWAGSFWSREGGKKKDQ